MFFCQMLDHKSRRESTAGTFLDSAVVEATERRQLTWKPSC